MNETECAQQLLEEITAAFPSSDGAVVDAFIEANPDVALLPSPVDLHVVVPAYMLWCVRNVVRKDTLIHDFTVAALAEYGRSKNSAIEHLNFKHTCTAAQRQAVVKFLRWCLDPEMLLHEEQIERALRHWQSEAQR